MNYRQIETSREIRLWASTFIKAGAVALGCLSMYFANPEFKKMSDDLACKMKTKFKK